MLCLAVLVEHRLVTDTDSHRQTDTGSWLVPRGKNVLTETLAQPAYIFMFCVSCSALLYALLFVFLTDCSFVNFHSLVCLRVNQAAPVSLILINENNDNDDVIVYANVALWFRR